MRHSLFSSIIVSALLLMVQSCAIKDDLPLPLVKSEIVSILVSGQCDENGLGEPVSVINRETKTVDLYVNDLVDIHKLSLLNLEVSNKATVRIKDTDVIINAGADAYPTLDLSEELTLELMTYQTYEWKVRARQVIKREIEVENQVGSAIVDTVNHNVIIHVTPSQDLSCIKINKMSIGGVHGTVSPDITGHTLDFRSGRSFEVRHGWQTKSETWKVFVYNAENSISTTVDVFPHAVRAFVSGEKQNGVVPEVQYRKKGDSGWTTLDAKSVDVGNTSYSAEIDGLSPGLPYEVQVLTNGVATDIVGFTTASAQQIENGSFDNWSEEGSGKQTLYKPWGEGQSSFWDTGNRGATTVGASNSTCVTEGGRSFANLQSRYIVIKFAAGNIFTGTYLKTDGTNGILSMGRPFTSFPTKLQFDYRFHSSLINKGGNKWEDAYERYMSKSKYDGLRGKPDECQVFVALIGDADEEVFEGTTYPLVIRTRPSELKLFNPQSDNVIAYGEFTKNTDVDQWTTHTIDIEYCHKNRTPKYIVIVASSSRYGDFFTGGDESLLQLDEMKLLYE